MVKVQGCIQKSADIMHTMNELVKVKDMSETMRQMAREMEHVRTLNLIRPGRIRVPPLPYPCASTDPMVVWTD